MSFVLSESNHLLAQHPGYARRPEGASLMDPLLDVTPEQTLALLAIWSSLRPSLAFSGSVPVFLGPPLSFRTVADVFDVIGPDLVSLLSRCPSSTNTLLSRFDTVLYWILPQRQSPKSVIVFVFGSWSYFSRPSLSGTARRLIVTPLCSLP